MLYGCNSHAFAVLSRANWLPRGCVCVRENITLLAKTGFSDLPINRFAPCLPIVFFQMTLY